jgi:hypothetical protein
MAARLSRGWTGGANRRRFRRAIHEAVILGLADQDIVTRRWLTVADHFRPRSTRGRCWKRPADKNKGGGGEPRRLVTIRKPLRYDFGAAFGVQRRRLSVLV